MDKRTALRFEGVQGVDGFALGGDGVEQTEAFEHALAGRLELEARTDRPHLGRTFDEGDGVTGAGQHDGERTPGNSESDDANVIGWRHQDLSSRMPVISPRM